MADRMVTVDGLRVKVQALVYEILKKKNNFYDFMNVSEMRL